MRLPSCAMSYYNIKTYATEENTKYKLCNNERKMFNIYIASQREGDEYEILYITIMRIN